MVDEFVPQSSQASPRSHPITLVISEVVDPHHIDEYEAWTAGINRAAQGFEGFLGVDIIRPRDHDHPEYVVIVKFDNYTHFKRWMTSATYRQWMEQSHRFIAERTHQELPTGLEMWFTLPEHAPRRVPQPAFYKQVILGVMGVYPLILLANWLLGPRLQGLPPLLALLISVTFVSALLTYPVMPWLSKGLSRWLYPSTVRSRPKLR